MVGVGMVEIPAGRFRMGSVGFYPEEGPGSARSRWFRDRPRDGYGRGVARFAEETGYRTLAERPPEAADVYTSS